VLDVTLLQMIWEQQCTKIVDLTTAEESSVQSYWPQQLNETLDYHLLKVSSENYHRMPSFLATVLMLR
jgi:Protein-tyrosine phosphatase